MRESLAITVMSPNPIDDKRLYCPRCQLRGAVQSAVELRLGTSYLVMRCASCGLVYDAQVSSANNSSSPVN
jgi:rubredoxin